MSGADGMEAHHQVPIKVSPVWIVKGKQARKNNCLGHTSQVQVEMYYWSWGKWAPLAQPLPSLVFFYVWTWRGTSSQSWDQRLSGGTSCAPTVCLANSAKSIPSLLPSTGCLWGISASDQILHFTPLLCSLLGATKLHLHSIMTRRTDWTGGVERG